MHDLRRPGWQAGTLGRACEGATESRETSEPGRHHVAVECGSTAGASAGLSECAEGGAEVCDVRGLWEGAAGDEMCDSIAGCPSLTLP
eukprot:1142688-Pelagomonas_calceolata.AAC.2